VIDPAVEQPLPRAGVPVRDASTSSTLYSYYVLCVLVLIFILNWMDRMVLSILLVPKIGRAHV